MKTFIVISFVTTHMMFYHSVIAQKTTQVMENNKAIATQFYNDVINRGDTSIIKSIIAENFIDHYAPPTQPGGIEGLKQFLIMVSNAFPDIRVKIEEMLMEGNKVVVRLTIEGTQTGVLQGNIPPSGMHAVWTGIDILKIENGVITERWSQRDLLNMMKQIGAIR